MKHFATLYEALDSTTSTNEKVAAMVDYFTSASPADAAWALFFLTGRRFKRFISSRMMTDWFLQTSGMPGWLFSESYEAVGDTAETISLLIDSMPKDVMTGKTGGETPSSINESEVAHAGETEHWSLAEWIEHRILPLQHLQAEDQMLQLADWWKTLSRAEVYMLNKLLSGAFRVGVSQTLVVRAIAQVAGLTPARISHRLMGNWEPTGEFFQSLISDAHTEDDSRPYPFFLAYQLDQDVRELGDITAWQVEWKWDGIRAQLIKRNGEIYLWSRGEDLITERFPEIVEAASALPNGTVLDGEILAYDFEKELPFPFAILQTRIGRKSLSKKILEGAPVVFMAYDLLETEGQDIRETALKDRRRMMSDLIGHVPDSQQERFRISRALLPENWDEVEGMREQSRERGVEGFVLKKLESPYQTGRKKGDWWKWKVDPFTVDAVLIYAQAGSGKRGNLYTDYTFAVWQEERLVPVAKAYSGLSNEEIEKLDRWIRSHTLEKFGPVRSVEAHHVFELAFEAIAPSSRHKSGVALRFPRIARWRHDKTPPDADTLERLKELIHATR